VNQDLRLAVRVLAQRGRQAVHELVDECAGLCRRAVQRKRKHLDHGVREMRNHADKVAQGLQVWDGVDAVRYPQVRLVDAVRGDAVCESDCPHLVRLLCTLVAREGLVARTRDGYPLAANVLVALRRQLRESPEYNVGDVVLDLLRARKRPLHVELRKLGLPVGAQVLVPVAARPLHVARDAARHEHLLVLLGALAQRVRRPALARRHEELAGALGRRLEQRRRLDVDEAFV